MPKKANRMLEELRDEMKALADSQTAKQSLKFFKSGPGEYGEGDKFLGIRVPVQRQLAKKYESLDLASINELLQSDFHEERLLALLVMVRKYDRGDEKQKNAIVELYCSQRSRVNNWDLVDSSAFQILGEHLRDRPRKLLYEYAVSNHLWDRRIAMIATMAFIRANDFDDALKIAKMLMGDQHDLIHKASGWMLREIGEREMAPLEAFLDRNASRMPRTMLRYAIEKLPEEQRQAYLAMGKMKTKR